MTDELDGHDDAIRAFAEWQIELWGMARTLLEGRPGWHFEVEDDTGFPYWRFGEEGAARLVLTVRYDIFMLYDADADKEHPVLADERGLKLLIEKHEPEHTGLTEAQVQFGVHMIHTQLDKWTAEGGRAEDLE